MTVFARIPRTSIGGVLGIHDPQTRKHENLPAWRSSNRPEGSFQSRRQFPKENVGSYGVPVVATKRQLAVEERQCVVDLVRFNSGRCLD